VAAIDSLRSRGFSVQGVNGFFRPFFAGVFLEDELATSSRFLDLMLRMFVRGRSTVPAAGMQELPRQLATSLRPGSLVLDLPADSLTAHSVTTAHGTVEARAVLCATDATSAAGLAGTDDVTWRSVTTIYHVAPTDPLGEPTLVLDADPGSPVVNTVVMTAAAPTYGPGDGRALVATSVLGTGGDSLEPEVRRRLGDLYGVETQGWEHLRTYVVPRALPAMTAPHPFRRPLSADEVYVCGDHRATSSIQGALVSGRRAADAVLADRR